MAALSGARLAPDAESSLLISNSHRFIFVHIPKTAGMSVRHALTPYCNGAQRKGLRRLVANLPIQEDPEKVAFPLHVTARWARRKLPSPVFDGYLKFAITRNPYDRAMSYVEFLRQTPRLRRHAQYCKASFLEALDMLGQRRRKETQADMVVGHDGQLLIDRVLRLETLDADFAALRDELGLPASVTLPWHNATDHGRYLDYYEHDAAAREKVAELFADDFRVFGYDLDPRKREAVAPPLYNQRLLVFKGLAQTGVRAVR